jgi:hypothetical protein
MLGSRFAIAGAYFLIATSLACAADSDRSLQARLSSDRLGHLEPGTYQAGEKTEFELGAAGSSYLLRCNGSPEVFVLTPDSAPMGGRVLRYDSGETALHVSGWGGVTFYTDADPEGLPAVRTGAVAVLPKPEVSMEDIRGAAGDLADAIERTHRIDLVFSVDWSSVPDTSLARAGALDAMENIARGIERLGRSLRSRQILAHRISEVLIARGGTPAVKLSGKVLLITFNPETGYEGRASSRAIASALGTLLGAAQKQS